MLEYLQCPSSAQTFQSDVSAQVQSYAELPRFVQVQTHFYKLVSCMLKKQSLSQKFYAN